MSIPRSRLSSNDTQQSDALADIALNTLGLILIVMLVYILLFRQTTQKIAHAAQISESRIQDLEHVAADNERLREQLAETDQHHIETLRQRIEELKSNATDSAEQLAQNESRLANLKSALEQERARCESIGVRLGEATDCATALTTEKKELNERIVALDRELATSEKNRDSERERARRLQQKIQKLETQVETLAEGSRMSGLWRFRNNVVELVDHNDDSESVDWTIDYFLYLNVVDGEVTGALFGAHEIETADNKGNSQSFAEISGRISDSGYLDVELAFSQGTTDTGSEHLRCRFIGEKFVGRLESGSHRYGYRNYVGPTLGTRLTESVFR